MDLNRTVVNHCRIKSTPSPERNTHTSYTVLTRLSVRNLANAHPLNQAKRILPNIPVPSERGKKKTILINVFMHISTNKTTHTHTHLWVTKSLSLQQPWLLDYRLRPLAVWPEWRVCPRESWRKPYRGKNTKEASIFKSECTNITKIPTFTNV